ncbi:Nephrocystin-3 [Stylophora pistillata]|uniref:Nephrocystin-3 n=1 Tax=Stylophora pistillata TaxID=50429 RepID=A0A2B4S6D6_STYPI|nr:Nephrocystin-3 [Stylophora pistillata]
MLNSLVKFTMQYSEEQLNYFRLCHVGFNLVPEGLRRIFKQEWNFRFKTPLGGEWQDTPQNGRQFFSKEGKRSRSKNARYLATVQSGNTTEWDCSCLFFAILYSDSIGSTLAVAIKSDVDDLRQVRNDIAHICEGKLTDAEFQNHIGRVLRSFTSLGLQVNDIEAVRKQTSFPTAELQNLASLVDTLKKESKRKEVDLQETRNTLRKKEEEVEVLTQEIEFKIEPFCILSSEPSHEVIRRTNDIKRLMEKLKDLQDATHDQQTVSTVYISGTPGCGKTQLARQLGQEFFATSRDSHGLTFVATINAESIETIATSYITLGKHLGITEYSLTKLETSRRERPPETIQYLKLLIMKRVRKFSKWLIIADNVDQLNAVRRFLPQTSSKEWGHGQVLFTTQNGSSIPCNAKHTYHESFSQGMEEDEAVNLLKSVSQIADEEKAKQVVKVLEYQPLALAAAAYYVQTVAATGSPHYSWADYLAVLMQGQREATEELLAKESPAYPHKMTTAIRLALKKAIENDTVLRQTFIFLSLGASESIPMESAVEFVHYYCEELPEELVESKISRSSLFLFANDGEGTKFMRLHSTVHNILKERSILNLESTESYENTATAIGIFHNLIRSEKTRLREEGYTYALLNKVKNHCKALLHYLKSQLTSLEGAFEDELVCFIDPWDIIHWMWSTAKICNTLRDFSSADWISEIACNLLDKWNCQDTGLPNVILKVGVLSVRGTVHMNIGKYQQAKELFEQALSIQQTFVEEFNMAAGVSRMELGDAPNKQSKVCNWLLMSIEYVPLADLYNDLGMVYCFTEQHNQAIEQLEKALEILKMTYGEDHPRVPETYNRLGFVYSEIGKYKEAKDLLEKAVHILAKNYGEEHVYVADTCCLLAKANTHNEEYETAKELYVRALKVQMKIRGEDLSVAHSYFGLGGVFHSIGQNEKAKEQYEKGLVIQRTIFNEENAIIARTYSSLGEIYRGMEELSQATHHHNKALNILKNTFGEGHRDVAACYTRLGHCFLSIQQYNEAKENYEKALMIPKKIFGEEHRDVATGYYNLANMYEEIGEYKEAIELYKNSLAIRRKIDGDKHSEVERIFIKLKTINKRLKRNVKKTKTKQSQGRPEEE